MINFSDIKELFDDRFQLGVLNSEETIRIANIRLKGYSHAGRTIIFTPKTQKYWRQFKSSLVILQFSDIAYDYTIKPTVEKIINAKYTNTSLITYCFKSAAIEAGLAIQAKNNLVWSTKFGFNCKITALGFRDDIIGYNKQVLPNFFPNCKDCIRCISACPGDALKNDTFNRDNCESIIGPQVQSHLIRYDKIYRRTVIPWEGVAGGIKEHCRVCQEKCPHNL